MARPGNTRQGMASLQCTWFDYKSVLLSWRALETHARVWRADSVQGLNINLSFSHGIRWKHTPGYGELISH